MKLFLLTPLWIVEVERMSMSGEDIVCEQVFCLLYRLTRVPVARGLRPRLSVAEEASLCPPQNFVPMSLKRVVLKLL